MMKNISTIIVLAFFNALVFSSCSNDEEGNSVIETKNIVSVAMNEAGTLSRALQDYAADEITQLTINGSMNARDFRYLKSNCTSMQELDLSNVKIKSYKGDAGTNDGATYFYAADEIPLGAFFHWVPVDEGMPSLRKVVLPDNIMAIRRNGFARAYNLTDINFPEGLKTIDYVAFALCTSLKSITLPSSLEEIGVQAFSNCEKLERIHIKANYPPSLADDAFEGISHNAKVIVPKGSYDAYRKSLWSNYFEISEAAQ